MKYSEGIGDMCPAFVHGRKWDILGLTSNECPALSRRHSRHRKSSKRRRKLSRNDKRQRCCRKKVENGSKITCAKTLVDSGAMSDLNTIPITL